MQQPEAHLTKIFEWIAERGLSFVRLIIGAAGAVVLTYITAVLQDDSDVSPLETVGIGVSLVVLVAVASYQLLRLNALEREYAAAVGLLARLRRLRRLLYP